MKIVKDEDGEYIETGITDLDGDQVVLVFMDGFGSTDIAIEWGAGITWKDFDKLKKAFELAEKTWRK